MGKLDEAISKIWGKHQKYLEQQEQQLQDALRKYEREKEDEAILKISEIIGLNMKNTLPPTEEELDEMDKELWDN